jgi:transforming growth factor-beta-induced protein
MGRFSALLVGLILITIACSSGNGPTTVAGVIARATNLNTLEQVLEVTDLMGLFADPNGIYTFFAPTNEAFAAFGTLPEGDALARVLQYHALSEKLGSSDLRANTTGVLETIEGSTITLKIDNGKILLNDTTELVTTDLEASNGVVHIINKVLSIPPATQ